MKCRSVNATEPGGISNGLLEQLLRNRIILFYLRCGDNLVNIRKLSSNSSNAKIPTWASL